MENSDGLVLVDQHAAHERILFEELRRRMEEQGVPSQRMLLPQTFSLPPRDAEWVERNVATLQKMGIGIKNFGAKDRKSTRLNSSHVSISYAVFCLKKKKKKYKHERKNEKFTT